MFGSTFFAPGELSRQQADKLNELVLEVERLKKMDVAPPLTISRPCGIPMIGAHIVSGTTVKGFFAMLTTRDPTGFPPDARPWKFIKLKTLGGSVTGDGPESPTFCARPLFTDGLKPAGDGNLQGHRVFMWPSGEVLNGAEQFLFLPMGFTETTISLVNNVLTITTYPGIVSSWTSSNPFAVQRFSGQKEFFHTWYTAATPEIGKVWAAGTGIIGPGTFKEAFVAPQFCPSDATTVTHIFPKAVLALSSQSVGQAAFIYAMDAPASGYGMDLWLAPKQYGPTGGFNSGRVVFTARLAITNGGGQGDGAQVEVLGGIDKEPFQGQPLKVRGGLVVGYTQQPPVINGGTF